MAKVQLHGLDQLRNTLKDLPAHLGEKVLRGGLRAGGNVFRKEARNNAPVLQKPAPHRKPGTVRDAIVVRRSKQEKYGVYVSVKPLGKSKIKSFKQGGGKSNQNPDDPFYWIFREFGTSSQPAEPFMRPAFEAKKMEALGVVESRLKSRVVAEAKKLARSKGMPS